MRRMFYLLCYSVCLLCGIGFFFFQKADSYAATEQKKPSIQLQQKNTAPPNAKAKITATITGPSQIQTVKWLQGAKKVADFKKAGKTLKLNQKNQTSIQVTHNGTYTFYAKDKAGSEQVKKITVETLEWKAMWISYLEFKKTGYTETQFQDRINEMFDRCKDLHMNAVIVQIRPFGDAFYPSEQFPWSAYVSGKQGKNPGYDPLAYMVKAAHERDLEFHAWLNPYRVTLNTTDYNTLSDDNPAKKWKKENSKDRHTLSFGGNLYYNPANREVQDMITKEIAWIVEKYEVDGIHFDDYFYPTLGSKYKSNFDAQEYKQYQTDCKNASKTALSIVNWRRNNVSQLVKNIYTEIKNVRADVQFGISPAGNVQNLLLNDRHYVDIKKWLSQDGYVDYIAPQIYWSLSHPTAAFGKMLQPWLDLRTNPSVHLYVGIAAYKAGESVAGDPAWKNEQDQLKRQILYSRKTGEIAGFCFFRYESFAKTKTNTVKEIKALQDVL